MPFSNRKLFEGTFLTMFPLIVMVSALIFLGQYSKAASEDSVASWTRMPSIEENRVLPLATSIYSKPSLYQNVSSGAIRPVKVVGRTNFLSILL